MDDLISIILYADIDGEKLTQLQTDLFFMLLQNASSETTRNLITSGTLALLNHPDQMEMLTRIKDLDLDAEQESLPRVWSNLIDGYAKMPIRWSEVTEKAPAD